MELFRGRIVFPFLLRGANFVVARVEYGALALAGARFYAHLVTVGADKLEPTPAKVLAAAIMAGVHQHITRFALPCVYTNIVEHVANPT